MSENKNIVDCGYCKNGIICYDKIRSGQKPIIKTQEELTKELKEKEDKEFGLLLVIIVFVLAIVFIGVSSCTTGPYPIC